MSRGGRGRQRDRIPAGMDYGDRQPLEAIDAAAQAIDASAAPPGGPVSGGAASPAPPMLPPSMPPPPGGEAFGPTERPWEPQTAGAPVGPGPAGPPSSDSEVRMWLEALYGVLPNRHLTELMEYLDA